MSNYIQEIQPGDFIVTDFETLGVPYQHWSVVSDRRCDKGRYMLISATKRTGTVQEETWDVVTQNKKSRKVPLQRKVSVEKVLSSVRTVIGQWEYSVWLNNCEHLCRWAAGHKMSSSQIQSLVIAFGIGSLLSYTVSEKPTLFKVIGVGAVLGLFGLALSQVSEKKSDSKTNKSDLGAVGV